MKVPEFTRTPGASIFVTQVDYRSYGSAGKIHNLFRERASNDREWRRPLKDRLFICAANEGTPPSLHKRHRDNDAST
jgi:hypothetical protein